MNCKSYRRQAEFEKMFLIFISVFFLARGGGSQITDTEQGCDPAQLELCVKLIPPTPIGLPRNRVELDAHCQAYQTGMGCMDAWIRRCLPTDGQKLVQQQIGGARALMHYLCSNDTALRRDFLKEPTCWARVSPTWSACVDELQVAVRDITEQSQHLTYFNKNAELCCAREEFLYCVGDAGRVCNSAASTLLRRMAWVLAQDVSSCAHRARCSAPAPPHPATRVLAILALMLYPALQYV